MQDTLKAYNRFIGVGFTENQAGAFIDFGRDMDWNGFDPERAYAALTRAGLTEKQARVLVEYTLEHLQCSAE